MLEKIKELLDKRNIKYSIKHHEPVYTSEQAAKVRGDNLKQGAKAIIMKTKEDYVLVVISGGRKIDSKKLKKLLSTRNLSFADREKVQELGLESGSVSPFGSVIGLKTYVDKSLLKNKEIAFNAGSLTNSIKMKLKDYLDVEKPIVADFS
jgi:Ala-tRNA(Pro) deacylase